MKVNMQRIREKAFELQPLGFNLHQALALVLMKVEWEPKLARECAADDRPEHDRALQSSEKPHQPI